MKKSPSRLLTPLAASAVSLFSFIFTANGEEKPARNLAASYAKLAEFQIVRDIVYKQIGETKLDLMLLLPAEKKFEKSPLVVFIHGGGFGGGDKFHVLRRDALGLARGLTQAGVTFACIEYRLTKVGEATVSDSVVDCKDAVRFLVKHAADYGIDANRVGLFGESAGGTLVLLTALGADQDYPGDPALAGTQAEVRCAADYYGPVSFVDPELMKGSNFENPSRLVSILGGTLEAKRDLAMKLSAIELLRADSPPLFIAHGDADKVINVRNSLAMRDAAQAKGVPFECVISKGAGHGFGGEVINPTIAEINRRTLEFFRKHLCTP